MTSLLLTVLGFFSGLFKAFGQILELWKSKDLIDQGKSLEQADLAKKEVIINREQTEILSQDRTREDVISKMEDGSF